MPERLNKYLATNLGISRREADDLIAAGKVLINEKTATLGDKISTTEIIKVNNNPVQTTKPIYLMLNKPTGYVSSRNQQDSTPTLYALLPQEHHNLKTVGRLDKDTSGLILLTNDGDFAFQMTHPKFTKTKEYEIELDRPLASLHQQMISDIGIQLPDGISQLTLQKLANNPKTWQITMHQGRNRQIRRTFGALGYRTIKLHRKTFGPYHLNNLKPGHYERVEKLG